MVFCDGLLMEQLMDCAKRRRGDRKPPVAIYKALLSSGLRKAERLTHRLHAEDHLHGGSGCGRRRGERAVCGRALRREQRHRDIDLLRRAYSECAGLLLRWER